MTHSFGEIRIIEKLFAISSVLVLSACASPVRVSDELADYDYGGEKYGQVGVSLSESVIQDLDKVERTEQLRLETNLTERLKSDSFYESGPYDPDNNEDVEIGSVPIEGRVYDFAESQLMEIYALEELTKLLVPA